MAAFRNRKLPNVGVKGTLLEHFVHSAFGKFSFWKLRKVAAGEFFVARFAVNSRKSKRDSGKSCNSTTFELPLSWLARLNRTGPLEATIRTCEPYDLLVQHRVPFVEPSILNQPSWTAHDRDYSLPLGRFIQWTQRSGSPLGVPSASVPKGLGCSEMPEGSVFPCGVPRIGDPSSSTQKGPLKYPSFGSSRGKPQGKPPFLLTEVFHFACITCQNPGSP